MYDFDALTTVTVDDKVLNLTKITYDDIQAGDVILHIWDSHKGTVDLWTGEATHGETEWYGPTRTYATYNQDGTFTVQHVRNVRDADDYGYVIASRWHGEEKNRSYLYRVVS